MKSNVNIEAIYNFEKEIYNNLTVSEKVESISGIWNCNNKLSQFKAHIKSEYGNALMLSDNKTSLGGNGVHPSPMQYMLFGIASGFVGALVTKAALNNYQIQDVKVEVVASTNYDLFFRIETRPAVEKLKIIVDIVTEEDEEQIKKLKEYVFECCPALSLIKDLAIDIIMNIHRP